MVAASACPPSPAQLPMRRSTLPVSDDEAGFRSTVHKLRALVETKAGDPGMTRTCDLRFRKPPLYPAELRDRIRHDVQEQRRLHSRRRPGSEASASALTGPSPPLQWPP
ncbi:hypothetical protein BRAS3843_930010 [Bradyrhizobium sp. STM 3843]|nr:hypothetical protein BRAS3843_930010 [Bradyrhizobium sp. STM 3843]